MRAVPKVILSGVSCRVASRECNPPDTFVWTGSVKTGIVVDFDGIVLQSRMYKI